jgi:aldose 1-dehydrogenase [NAD(P)+]
MKAIIVRPASKGVEVKNVNEKDVQNFGRIKIRIIENGICGTDREIVQGRMTSERAPQGRDWLVLGHEAIGKVEEGFGEFKVNDLVMPVNRRGCGKCNNCLMGRADHCETGEFVEAGISDMDGFMREYYYDDPRYLVKVPQGIEDIAILAQPLSDLEKSVDEIIKVQERVYWRCNDGTFSCRKALIMGTGPIGILFSMLLRTYSFQVTVANRREPTEIENQIFQEIGVDYYNSSKGYKEINKKFDIVFNASTAPPTVIEETLPLLNYNGVLGLFGFPPSGEMKVGFQEIQKLSLKGIAILGLSNGQKPHFEEAMRHLSQWKITWPKTANKLITRTVSVDEAPKVLSVKEENEIKVKIKW